MRAVFLCIALVLAALAAMVEPARACSCALPDPRSALAQADAAFVGVLVHRRQLADRAVLAFSVERSLKGPLGKTVDVFTASNGAGCGIEAPVGTRLGLVLERRDGAWYGHLCAEFAPADLIEAARPLPSPNGKGSAALLVGGRFGSARALALDAKGRTLAYGQGAGRVLEFSVCPGGRRLAELVQLDTGNILAIRELRTLRLVRHQRLKLVYVGPVRCMSATGERLIVFSSGGPDHPDRGRLTRITPRSATTIWRGTSWYASLTDRFAYVTELGGRLSAVNLRNRSVKKLARLTGGEYELIPNSARTRFAGLAYTEGRPRSSRLVLVDTRLRPVSVRTVPLPNAVGQLFWLSDGRLALFQNSEGAAVIFDRSLRVVSRFRWLGTPSTVVDSTAYGLSARALVAVELPAGRVRVVRRLPGAPSVIVSATR